MSKKKTKDYLDNEDIRSLIRAGEKEAALAIASCLSKNDSGLDDVKTVVEFNECQKLSKAAVIIGFLRYLNLELCHEISPQLSLVYKYVNCFLP